MSSLNETTVAPADALTDALARWKKTVEAELKGAYFDKKLMTSTFEGVVLQPLYTRADLAAAPDLARRPGEAPFLRGVRPQGYKERTWEIAQEIAVRSPQMRRRGRAATPAQARAARPRPTGWRFPICAISRRHWPA